MEHYLRVENIAAVVAGLVIAGILIAWPRPTLICLGLLSLLLGLLGISTLKAVNIPALVAIIGGIGLIGFGRLVGTVEELLKETMAGRKREGAAPDYPSPLDSTGTPASSHGRVEPRL